MFHWLVLDVLASASCLVVAAFALWKGPQNALRLPVTLLAVDQFSWNVAKASHLLSGDERYLLVSRITSPLFIPFVLHFVLVFVGKAKSLRPLLIGAYVMCIARSLLNLIDAVAPELHIPFGLSTHHLVILALGPPAGIFTVVLLARHLRATTSEAERWRAKFLLAGLATITVLLPIDVLAVYAKWTLPPLAAISSLALNLTLAQLVLGVGLVEGSRRNVVVLAVVASLFVIAAYLWLFTVFYQHQGLLLVTVTAITLGFVALGRLLFSSAARVRQRLEQHATLGRFSAQMAHDLKNPLAAAMGAAQVIAEDLRRNNSPDPSLVELLVQQLVRISDQIERYRRLSKFELLLRTVDVNALVRQVLSLKDFNAPEHVEVREALSPACQPIVGDPELLGSALENLVKNAFEAIAGAGTVTISTAVVGARLKLAVRDTGAGMDPRVLEQAFTPFFTTKATGSGMGLSFVQRVARAHGGDATVQSAEGAGTVVELWLPLAPGPQVPA